MVLMSDEASESQVELPALDTAGFAAFHSCMHSLDVSCRNCTKKPQGSSGLVKWAWKGIVFAGYSVQADIEQNKGRALEGECRGRTHWNRGRLWVGYLEVCWVHASTFWQKKWACQVEKPILWEGSMHACTCPHLRQAILMHSQAGYGLCDVQKLETNTCPWTNSGFHNEYLCLSLLLLLLNLHFFHHVYGQYQLILALSMVSHQSWHITLKNFITCWQIVHVGLITVGTTPGQFVYVWYLYQKF